MRKSFALGFFRRPTRFAVRAPCEVIRLRDFRVVADRVDDVSSGGVLVSPAEAVLTGEPVLVSLRFPNTGDWFEATATVTRVLHGRRPGEWTRSLGLEFEGLDGVAEEVLAANLGRIPPAPPRARPGRRLPSIFRAARLAAPAAWGFAT